MSSERVAYSFRSDATPENERAALGAIYGFVLRCHAEREAAGSNDDEGEETESGNVSRERKTVVEEASTIEDEVLA